MAVNANFVDINPFVLCGELLDRRLVVFQRIVAHIAVTKVVVPFRTPGMTSTLADRNDNKAELGQTVCAQLDICP